jgi:TPR repeat protein
MVNPVIAADGHTYERQEITQWLASNNTSPKTNLPLEHKALIPNLSVKQQIEELVASGELDDEVCAGYLERKEAVNLEQAQKLYDEGKVEEAAELGLPEAQGEMANRCWDGTHGVAKDHEKCVEWAKKAAAGGDRLGQFRLGYAYHEGEGGLEKDWAMALKWYEKAAEQGCAASMNNIGVLYKNGGHGVTQNFATAVSWFRKAAEAGNADGQSNLGECYYDGRGVTRNVRTARSWYQKSADQANNANALAMRKLGAMMVKGEGGEMDVNGGRALWEAAAAKGDTDSQTNLDRLKAVLSRVALVM